MNPLLRIRKSARKPSCENVTGELGGMAAAVFDWHASQLVDEVWEQPQVGVDVAGRQ
jgi:hypothetical protein